MNGRVKNMDMISTSVLMLCNKSEQNNPRPLKIHISKVGTFFETQHPSSSVANSWPAYKIRTSCALVTLEVFLTVWTIFLCVT